MRDNHVLGRYTAPAAPVQGEEMVQGTSEFASAPIGHPAAEDVSPLQDSYNDGYTHEALHTTHVLMETFADHVMDTRCADEFPDVKAAADQAHQALFDLYQLIGTKFADDPPPRTQVGDNLTGASTGDDGNCPQLEPFPAESGA